ncbi:MAG: hypothetical protein ACLUEQ_08535 [Cloacibacillus evryensis]
MWGRGSPEMPEGCGRRRARAAPALKHGDGAQHPGTIDSVTAARYASSLRTSAKDFTIEPGDRIAQIVFAAVTRGSEAPELGETSEPPEASAAREEIIPALPR